jgi:hypothetical protein
VDDDDDDDDDDAAPSRPNAMDLPTSTAPRDSTQVFRIATSDIARTSLLI